MPPDHEKSKKELIAELEAVRQENAGLRKADAERKQAEEALKESEEQLRAILDNAAAAIYVKDLEGRFLLVNKIIEKMFHLTQNDIIGKFDLDVFDKQTARQNLENDRQVIETRKPARFDEAIVQDDELHHFLSIKFPLLDASGTPFAVGGISTDITDLKRAEEALKESEERYRDLFENAPVGIVRSTATGRVLMINPAFAAIAGYDDPAEMVEGVKDVANLYTDPAQREEMKRLLAQHGELRGYEIQHKRKDGGSGWISFYAKTLQDTDGEVLFDGFVVDITDRKRTEEALRETLAEFEAIFENSAMGILLLKGDRRIHRINSRCAEMLGYTEEEALGRTTRMVHTSDESFKAFGERVYPALVAGETAHAEHMLVRKDGTTVWCDFYGKALFPQELEKGSIWVFVDITERMELESLREDVERILRHDLRTPLSSVVGLPKVMLDDENLTPEQTGYLKLIQDAGYRMLNQINLSLDLYKMEMGTFQYQPNPVESNGLLKRLLHDLGLKAGSKGVGLEVLVKGVPWGKAESLQFQADEALCYTMLANLLDNAVDASPLGARVTLRLEEDPDIVAFSVHNVGAVPEPVRDNFFDKYTTHGKSGGTGLGTYSARLMAEAQGGSIQMESSREEGTTVTIRLPKD